MIRDYESRDIGSIPIRSIFGDVMQLAEQLDCESSDIRFKSGTSP